MQMSSSRAQQVGRIQTEVHTMKCHQIAEKLNLLLRQYSVHSLTIYIPICEVCLRSDHFSLSYLHFNLVKVVLLACGVLWGIPGYPQSSGISGRLPRVS